MCGNKTLTCTGRKQFNETAPLPRITGHNGKSVPCCSRFPTLTGHYPLISRYTLGARVSRRDKQQYETRHDFRYRQLFTLRSNERYKDAVTASMDSTTFRNKSSPGGHREHDRAGGSRTRSLRASCNNLHPCLSIRTTKISSLVRFNGLLTDRT